MIPPGNTPPATTPLAGQGSRRGGPTPLNTPPETDAWATLVLDGRLDALRALPLRAELAALVGGAGVRGRGVLVDLSEVVYVDSAGLAALVSLRRGCLSAGLDLALVRPRHGDALRIFRLTQFDQVFTMIDEGPGSPDVHGR